MWRVLWRQSWGVSVCGLLSFGDKGEEESFWRNRKTRIFCIEWLDTGMGLLDRICTGFGFVGLRAFPSLGRVGTGVDRSGLVLLRPAAVSKYRGVRIREADDDDLLAVSELRAREMLSKLSLQKRVYLELKQLREGKSLICFVMCIDDVLVGAVDAFPRGKDIYLGNFIIRSTHRRNGLGRLLITDMLHYAENSGADQTLLHVSPTNYPALTLYKQVGFLPHENQQYHVPHLPSVPVAHTLLTCKASLKA